MDDEPPVTENKGTRVLLIDLENCPSQLKQLPADLACFERVLICYANNTPKIPLEWLNVLAAALNANRLKVVRMEVAGKNAADFGISFFAGALMRELPENAHFVIVSNDTDLDHVVRLLIQQGRSAERIGKRIEEAEPPARIEAPKQPLIDYCKHLITHSKTRPAKEATLRSSIRAKFQHAPVLVTEIMNALIDGKAIQIANGAIIYNDAALQRILEGASRQ